MHFPRENAYFSGSRAGKKCIYTISRKFVYAFFGVAWNLKNMHFPRENAYFSGSRAGKKMHIHNFPKKLYMHFLGWPGISKICIFLGKMHIFQDPGLEKKCIYTISRKICICIFWGGLESQKYAFS